MSDLANTQQWLKNNVEGGLWKNDVKGHLLLDGHVNYWGSNLNVEAYLSHMNTCYSVIILELSQMSSVFSDNTGSPAMQCKKVLQNFGLMTGGADTTCAQDMAALATQVKTLSPDLQKALHIAYPGEAYTQITNTLTSQANLLANVNNGNDLSYANSLKHVNDPKDGAGAACPNYDLNIKDITKYSQALKQYQGAVTTIFNIFTSVSQSCTSQMKSYQATQTAVMTLLTKIMQGDYSVVKTSLGNQSRGG